MPRVNTSGTARLGSPSGRSAGPRHTQGVRAAVKAIVFLPGPRADPERRVIRTEEVPPDSPGRAGALLADDLRRVAPLVSGELPRPGSPPYAGRPTASDSALLRQVECGERTVGQGHPGGLEPLPLEHHLTPVGDGLAGQPLRHRPAAEDVRRRRSRSGRPRGAADRRPPSRRARPGPDGRAAGSTATRRRGRVCRRPAPRTRRRSRGSPRRARPAGRRTGACGRVKTPSWMDHHHSPCEPCPSGPGARKVRGLASRTAARASCSRASEPADGRSLTTPAGPPSGAVAIIVRPMCCTC